MTDQMSLWEIIGYNTSLPTVFTANISSASFTVKRFECKHINHIYDGEINETALILHYKGVWNDFLIKGIIPSPSNFQKYKIFGNVFKEALEYLNKKLGSSFSQEFFNIRLHKLFYENSLEKYGLKYNIARNVYKIKNWLSKRFS